MPRLLFHRTPAVRDPVDRNESSPSGTESIFKEVEIQDMENMRRRKNALPRFRRLRVVRIYNVPVKSPYISPRDVGGDKIQPPEGGAPAPSVAPASVALPAQPPLSLKAATKQIFTTSQSQTTATHPSRKVFSLAKAQSNTIGADDAQSSSSYSGSYSQQQHDSSTSIASYSLSTSDQHDEVGTSSSKLGSITAAKSSPPTTLATLASHTVPCSTVPVTAVQPTNMVTLKHGALSPGRNVAIVEGSLGALAAFFGLIFLILLFRRNRWFDSLKRFISKRKAGVFKRKEPSGSISGQISAPLEGSFNLPTASATAWNYEETFAKPSVPPPSRLSRIFRGPLSLHPPTPPPMSTTFQSPEPLARAIFKNQRLSAQTMPSPTQPKRAPVYARSSLILPHHYDRLPSSLFAGEDSMDSQERRAMSYFSRPSSGGTTRTLRPRSPPLTDRRQSRATMKSIDSEPARFRSVPSWVNHHSQSHKGMSQRGVGLDENPVPQIPETSRYSVSSTLMEATSMKRKPARSIIQSRGTTHGEEVEEKTNAVFEEHPGTRVEVPGLQGKRIRSTVLDRNIWGWGLNR